MAQIPSPDPLARACAICGRVLSRLGDDDYRHAQQDIAAGMDDHPAVPVPYEEAGEQFRGRCDFCSAEQPTHVLWSEEIETPEFDSVWDAHWSACDDCAELIKVNDWRGLFRRSRTTYEAQFGPLLDDVALEIRVLHYRVRKGMIGLARA
jgi:hypothetical protein